MLYKPAAQLRYVETFNVSMEIDSDSSNLYGGNMELDTSSLDNSFDDVLAINFAEQPPPPTLEEELQLLNDRPLREMPHIVVFGNSHAQRMGHPHPVSTLHDHDGPVASITYLGVGGWDPSDRHPSR